MGGSSLPCPCVSHLPQPLPLPLAVLYRDQNVWLVLVVVACTTKFFWGLCMAINVSVQHNGGFLPGILPVVPLVDEGKEWLNPSREKN